MITRERIEAEIARLDRPHAKLDDAGMFKSAAIVLDVMRNLRSILADLPAEKPPTLAEFKESGELFLAMDNDSAVYLFRFRADTNNKLWNIGANQLVTNNSHTAFIKRLCDREWYPVEGGE